MSPRLSDAGRRLLLMLGQMPEGLANKDVDGLFGVEAVDAAAGLRKVGLALAADGRVTTLPPIREHAVGKGLDAEDKTRLLAHFLKLGAALPESGLRSTDPDKEQHAGRELAAIDLAIDLWLKDAPQSPSAADVKRLRYLASLSSGIGDRRWLRSELVLSMRSYERTRTIFQRSPKRCRTNQNACAI